MHSVSADVAQLIECEVKDICFVQFLCPDNPDGQEEVRKQFPDIPLLPPSSRGDNDDNDDDGPETEADTEDSPLDQPPLPPPPGDPPMLALPWPSTIFDIGRPNPSAPRGSGTGRNSTTSDEISSLPPPDPAPNHQETEHVESEDQTGAS